MKTDAKPLNKMLNPATHENNRAHLCGVYSGNAKVVNILKLIIVIQCFDRK